MFVLYFLVLIAEVVEASFSSTLEVTVASLEVAVASLETLARASVIVVVVAASCRTCLVATTDVLAVFLIIIQRNRQRALAADLVVPHQRAVPGDAARLILDFLDCHVGLPY